MLSHSLILSLLFFLLEFSCFSNWTLQFLFVEEFCSYLLESRSWICYSSSINLRTQYQVMLSSIWSPICQAIWLSWQCYDHISCVKLILQINVLRNGDAAIIKTPSPFLSETFLNKHLMYKTNLLQRMNDLLLLSIYYFI